MEILAPVGDRETLEAAVRSGADAIYLGLNNFNARRNARNFTENEFCDSLNYCKGHGVKTHIVLNILLNDDEMEQAVEMAEFAINSGADAFILQDRGLALYLKTKIPDIKLHASTQMTVHSKKGIKSLKEMGFERVVLSRELSLTEIKELTAYAKTLNVETEVFIHGALCMCMSGQCYLSSMIGSRSGNRGLCAQPCRLPFKTPEGYEYSLSLKDMSHLKYLDELIDAGVSSFKIEGRMKTPEYVAAAVTAVRQARDLKCVSPEIQNMLDSVFSRSGFCDGYITGKRNDMFGIRTKKDEALSKEIENKVHALYRNEYQRLPIEFELICKIGSPAILTARCEKFSCTVTGEEISTSVNRPLTKEFAAEKLSRLGSTPFFAAEISADIEEGSYLSISGLNALKNEAVTKLNLLISKEKTDIKITDNKPILPLKREKGDMLIRARFDNRLPDSLSGISRAYLTHTSDISLFERLIESGIETGVELPRVFFNNTDSLMKKLGQLRDLGVKYALCEGYEGVEIASSLGFECDLGAFSQITNSYSILNAAGFGVKSATVSFELTVEQINNLSSDIPVGFIGYGYLPLMMTRCCPLKNSRDCKNCNGDYLTDRKDKRFFVKCRDGVSELFNCVPLEMCNKKNQFDADFVLLYFTFETKEEIEKEISDWQHGNTHRPEFTHGLYYRGVL